MNLSNLSKQFSFSLPASEVKAVEQSVADILGVDSLDIVPFDSNGKVSTVYSCSVGGEKYIVKHSYDGYTLQKDEYASRFATPELPVPEVLGVKRLRDGSSIGVSRLMPGHEMLDTDFTADGPLMKIVLATLRNIHTTDVSDSHGYGFAKANGQGAFPKLLFSGRTRYSLEIGYWRFLAKRNTELKPSVFKEALHTHMQLSRFCITPRMLYHGDIKADNLLVHAGSVSAVLDWGRFGYGDPAIDLGNMYTRYPGAIDHEAYCETIGLTPKNIRQRVLYYAMNECVISIAFHGKRQDNPNRQAWEQRLLELAEEAKGL